MKDNHPDEEYLSMLLNMEYAMQCDSWICTLASNACRMIDELRATTAGKADKPFADLSTESCKEMSNLNPCFENGERDFGWRF